MVSIRLPKVMRLGAALSFVLLAAVLFSVSLLAANYNPEEIRSIVAESRFSGPFHRMFGWGDTVLNITHDFSSEEMTNLSNTLTSASFRNRTVIITTLNAAWAAEKSMVDLFLESFRVGEDTAPLLDHLVIVALDQTAYNRCSQLHRFCFFLQTDGVDLSRDKFFMSSDYLKMMWRRIDFLRLVLEMGFNILFSDADIMWLRDPFKYIPMDSDMVIACDRYNGHPNDLSNKANGGFVYVKSNKRSINFYKLWYKSRLSYPGKHDQDVLDEIKMTSKFSNIGVRMRFLDTLYFGGFCSPSKDLNKVCTMHANCCKGLDKKLNDLRSILDDWISYSHLTPQQAFHFRWSPKSCGRKW